MTFIYHVQGIKNIMSSEWVTEVGDDYDTWYEQNKLALKSGNKGKIVEGEGRIAIKYKFTDSINKTTLYNVINPQHIFSYSIYSLLH
jgi:hypothetical protein